MRRLRHRREEGDGAQRRAEPIKHVSSEKVSGWREAKKFEATADLARLKEPDALIICVPTPLTDSREPDLSFVEGSAQSIAAALRPGQLVVLESTTYPATTPGRRAPDPRSERPRLRPGLLPGLQPRAGRSGERQILRGRHPQGRRRARTRQRSKLACARCTPRRSSASCRCRAPEVAEACKILENTYRAVNIALVNELKTALRPDGDRRLGGDRRRQDEAVRLLRRSTPAPASAGTASRSTRST